MTIDQGINVSGRWEALGKSKFEVQLHAILEKELTVENIDSYADDVLNSIVGLAISLSKEYLHSHHGETARGRELEDNAAEYYGVKGLDDFLELAQKKVDQIKAIETYIDEHTQIIKEVITPTDPRSLPEGIGSSEKREIKIKSRLKTLLYILQSSGVDLLTITLIEGKNLPSMIRGLSYVSVSIPAMNRLVQICDEEGNATYVFDTVLLREKSLSDLDVDRMTKDEKNALIAQDPLVGQRVVQSVAWVARIEDLLEEITERTSRTASLVPADAATLPQISKYELDPWKGFWTDPATGKHWGSMRSIQLRAHLVYANLLRRLLNRPATNFRSQRAITSRGVRDIYPYEDVVAHQDVRDFINAPLAEEKGEWEDFWIDATTGKHYGPLTALINKFGIGRTILERNILAANLSSRKVRGKASRANDAYCYEDIAVIPEIVKISNTPLVASEGEWTGFWEDPYTGIHYGAANAIQTRLGLGSAGTIVAAAKRLGAVTVEIRTVSRSGTPGLPFETIQNESQIKEMTTLPRVETSGDWKNFYIDEDGKHWGAIGSLASKIGVHYNTVETIVKDQTLPKRRVATIQSPADAYCLESIESMSYIQLLLQSPAVAVEGVWTGFWTHPATGEHWAPIRKVAEHLQIPYNRIEDLVAEKSLPSKQIRGHMGKKITGVRTAYSLEAIQRLLSSGL